MNKHIESHTDRYIRAVNAIPRITKERELELARAWQRDRDHDAAKQLIEANLRNVVPMALRYRNQGPSLWDLISQGNVGLMTALDRFDPTRGLRFITYANHWIRSEMLSLVLSTRSMVGGGRGYQRGRYVFRMRREAAHLTAKLGQDQSVFELLSQRFGRPSDEIADVLALLERRDASTEAPHGDSASTLGDCLTDEADAHDEALAHRHLQQEVKGALADATSVLDERERFIVEHRLMAEPDARRSLLDIGNHFGVSRERARQLETRVKDKLRRRLQPIADRWELSSATAA
ncbi:MAG: RNA polymerase sigma factor RpoD/SigA [Myxococcales bacterium]|nr:RNA polymerase sigma factor RpoD/SigA [Myxococcales bacterium]MDD9968066.1 RNA polymerase sigma factor RpoD/SigA [Myxococcales bacterium]